MKHQIKNRLLLIKALTIAFVLYSCGSSEPPPSFQTPTPLLHDYMLVNGQKNSILYNSELLTNLTSNNNASNTEAALNALDSKATLVLKISDKGKPYADDIARISRNALKNKDKRVALAALVTLGVIEGIYYISSTEEEEIKNNSTTKVEFSTLPALSDEEFARIMENIRNLNKVTSAPASTPPSFTENTSTTPNFYGVNLKNNSQSTIWVAVRYGNKNKNWVTRGWWKVEPNELVETNIEATFQTIYVHAYNESGEYWGDENIFFYVADDKFTFKGDYYTPNSYTKYFFEEDTGEEWQTHTVYFGD